MTPRQIKVLILKKGISHKELMIKYNLKQAATRIAIKTPHKKGEEALSKELGIPLQILFPARYDQNGKRYEPQPTANYRYYTDRELLTKQAENKA